MRKQAIINLTEYYYGKHAKDLKKFTLFLVFFPILLTTFLSLLRLTGYFSVLMRTISDGLTLSSLLSNYLVWNASFNVIAIAIRVFKSLCFSIYAIGFYGIIKYRQPLSYRLIVDIFNGRAIACVVISIVLGISSWLIVKVPIVGGLLELSFSYITIYSVIVYLENSNTLGIIDAVSQSIKFTTSKFIDLILFDIFYLFTPTIIGVAIIAVSQIVGTLTSVYLLTMFGVFIGSIGICRKLPKAFLARMIFYLGNPSSRK